MSYNVSLRCAAQQPAPQPTTYVESVHQELLYSLQCGHTFHDACLGSYACASGVAVWKLKCPICKMVPHIDVELENMDLIAQSSGVARDEHGRPIEAGTESVGDGSEPGEEESEPGEEVSGDDQPGEEVSEPGEEEIDPDEEEEPAPKAKAKALRAPKTKAKGVAKPKAKALGAPTPKAKALRAPTPKAKVNAKGAAKPKAKAVAKSRAADTAEGAEPGGDVPEPRAKAKARAVAKPRAKAKAIAAAPPEPSTAIAIAEPAQVVPVGNVTANDVDAEASAYRCSLFSLIER